MVTCILDKPISNASYATYHWYSSAVRRWSGDHRAPPARRTPYAVAGKGDWTTNTVIEWPTHEPVDAPSVIGMTTTTPLVDQQRLPEHTQRLDWMTFAPDVFTS
jgi:hypothetical protein